LCQDDLSCRDTQQVHIIRERDALVLTVRLARGHLIVRKISISKVRNNGNALGDRILTGARRILYPAWSITPSISKVSFVQGKGVKVSCITYKNACSPILSCSVRTIWTQINVQRGLVFQGRIFAAVNRITYLLSAQHFSPCVLAD
jgi:hypothetical protein